MKKLSIIIPAYNEALTLRPLVEKILAVDFGVEYEVLIIDDRSHDPTYEIADGLMRDYPRQVRAFRNEKNQGKGFSIRRGFSNARGELVVVQDADFEYDPKDIAKMLEPLLQGRAEVVFGSRFLACAYPEGMALPNMVANRLLTLITNILYKTSLTDVYSCYKIIPLDMLKDFQLRLDGFESEAEILAGILRRKTRIHEIPISYQGRTVKQGKKIKARDFFKAVHVLFASRG